MNKGFTLAEVLITLGIIGIVAAMTLPTVIGKYQDMVIKSKVKKAYSVASQAVQHAIAENGTVDQWTTGNLNSANDDPNHPEIVMNRNISKYLEPVKSCGYSDRTACMSQNYKRRITGAERVLNISQVGRAQNLKNTYVTKDGIAYKIIANAGDYRNLWCTTTIAESMTSRDAYMGTCGSIYVDINGPQGPNLDGDDLFGFKIFKDGITPFGREYDEIWVVEFANGCLSRNDGYVSLGTCTAWIFSFDNVDYRHCPEKLHYKLQHSCKE